MSGFEMSPFGMVPIGTPYLRDSDAELAAKLVVQADYGHGPVAESKTAAPLAPAPSYAIVKKSVAVGTTMSPGGVIKAAKARVKEIKAELRRHAALQKELSELERLLKAAKQKPTSVRPLRSVG